MLSGKFILLEQYVTTYSALMPIRGKSWAQHLKCKEKMEDDYQIIENKDEQVSGFFALLLEIAERENISLNVNVQIEVADKKNS